MTRLRTVLAPPNTAEEEPALVRSFTVPSARAFGIVGTARLSLGAPDNAMDAALGQPDASSGGITVTASEHLTTSASARASSALDGDPTTAWSTQVGDTVGQWIDVQTPQPVTFDHLTLQVVADSRHSVPTQVRIDAGGQSRTVNLPAVADQPSQNAAVPAPVSFPALAGNDVRVTITAVRPEQTIEYYSDLPTNLPVAIAELGIPGVQRPALPTEVPSACRSDLLTLDGKPLPVRLVGSTATAVAGGTLQVQACNPDGGAPTTLHLSAGKHLLRAVPGTTTGIDVDGLVLASGAGGGAATLTAPATTLAAPASTPAPQVHLQSSGETTARATVRNVDGPFWLVLGESFNNGWHAVVNGHDLGAPQLVDGMSNGWLVNPGRASTLSVTLKWTPQNRIWVALAISGLTMLLCALLALWPRRRAVVARVDHPDGPVELASPLVARGSTPSRRAVISTTAAVALVAGLIVNPLVGIIAGALTVGVLVRPQLRWLLTVGAPAALAVAGGYVFIEQWRFKYPTIFTWPTFFDNVHVIGWLAVIFLSVDATVEFVRTRQRTDDSTTRARWQPPRAVRDTGRQYDRTGGSVSSADMPGSASRYRSLSVIVPVYNERNTVAEIVRRMRSVEVPLEREIVIVDDGSTDGTRQVLSQLADSTVHVVLHNGNQGKGAAVRTGLAQVTGDLVLIQDADLEYDPDDWPKLLAPALKGRARVVYGSRFTGERRNMLFVHWVGNRFLSLVTNVLYNTTLSDMETCYKLFEREIIQGLPLRASRFDFEPEVTAKVLRQGIRIYEVPISYSGREVDEGKKITWRDGFAALWTLVKYRFVT